MCGKWPTRFRDGWEHCYHFAKTKNLAMYQDSVKIPIAESTVKRAICSNPHDFKRMNYSETTGSHFGIKKAVFQGKELVYPNNVLYLSTESMNKGHSATFPIGLPTWFIKLFTKETDVILDPFVGSGTTCLASKMLNRRWIGIDISPEYVEIAQKRLAAIPEKITAFLSSCG